tara:strand:+ start:1184 stop:2353 length:1170 start_codon:yes stop_codon:yes gene_type:complete
MLEDDELLAEERESQKYSFLLADADAHTELPDLEQCAREDEEVRRRTAHALTLREQQSSDDEADLEQSMADWRQERERRVQQMLEAAAAEAGERSAEEDLQADLFAMTALGLSSVGGDVGTSDGAVDEGVAGRMAGEAAEPLSTEVLAAEVEASTARHQVVQERLQRDGLRAELAASEAARQAMLADLMGCAASASVEESAAEPPPAAAAAMHASHDAEREASGAEVDERRGRRSCQQRPLLSQAGAAAASGRVQASAQAASVRGSDDACRWARGTLAGAAAAPAAARAGSASHSRAPLLQRLADGAGGAVAPAALHGNVVRGTSASRSRPSNGPGPGPPLPKCVSLASTPQLLSQASERDLAGRKMAADLVSTRRVRPPSPAQRAVSR